jgi:nifR3 family TIM-barrel protein
MRNIWNSLPDPFFVLAPMDDVTDTVFRRIVGQAAAPDLYFTEFVNVDGLQSPGRQALMPKLKLSDQEHPIIAQIWGKKPENYYQSAKDIIAMGYDGIDINMGCPVKAVVKNNCCSALITEPERAADIIAATIEGAGDAPVSVKTRLGFNEVDLGWHEHLLKQGIAALTVHGRTRKEMSAVPAQWDTIGEIVKLRDRIAPGTKIIGNGDVQSHARGLELVAKHDVDGIMIGRGVFHDPFVFAIDSPWPSLPAAQRMDMYRHHIESFVDTWQHGERKLHTLNKFCKIYVNGFDNASELREKLMKAESVEELLGLLNDGIAAAA